MKCEKCGSTEFSYSNDGKILYCSGCPAIYGSSPSQSKSVFKEFERLVDSALSQKKVTEIKSTLRKIKIALSALPK